MVFIRNVIVVFGDVENSGVFSCGLFCGKFFNLVS